MLLGKQQTPHAYSLDTNRLSDLADAYPNGELVDAFRQDWVMAMIKEVRSNKELQQRTIDTARWAREQVKRQLGGSTQVMQQT